ESVLVRSDGREPQAVTARPVTTASAAAINARRRPARGAVTEAAWEKALIGPSSVRAVEDTAIHCSAEDGCAIMIVSIARHTAWVSLPVSRPVSPQSCVARPVGRKGAGMPDAIRVGTFTPSVLLRVARRGGWLRRAGVEVAETPVRSSPEQFAALLDGALDAV